MSPQIRFYTILTWLQESSNAPTGSWTACQQQALDSAVCIEYRYDFSAAEVYVSARVGCFMSSAPDFKINLSIFWIF